MNGLSPARERRLLQIAIAVGGIVPVSAGLYGGLMGAHMSGELVSAPSLDSHVRYLSGLLLGIGLAFWATVPRIECSTARVRLLTAIVAVGGLMRLLGIIFVAVPGAPMLFGLCMELVVTPLICLWQTRVSRLFEGTR